MDKNYNNEEEEYEDGSYKYEDKKDRERMDKYQ